MQLDRATFANTYTGVPKSVAYMVSCVRIRSIHGFGFRVDVTPSHQASKHGIRGCNWKCGPSIVVMCSSSSTTVLCVLLNPWFYPILPNHDQAQRHTEPCHQCSATKSACICCPSQHSLLRLSTTTGRPDPYRAVAEHECALHARHSHGAAVLPPYPPQAAGPGCGHRRRWVWGVREGEGWGTNKGSAWQCEGRGAGWTGSRRHGYLQAFGLVWERISVLLR